MQESAVQRQGSDGDTKGKCTQACAAQARVDVSQAGTRGGQPARQRVAHQGCTACRPRVPARGRRFPRGTSGTGRRRCRNSPRGTLRSEKQKWSELSVGAKAMIAREAEQQAAPGRRQPRVASSQAPQGGSSHESQAREEKESAKQRSRLQKSWSTCPGVVRPGGHAAQLANWPGCV